MRLVIIESPYAGKDLNVIELNITYARSCVKDSLMRGEAPIASHLLYTQPGILDDSDDVQRQLGIDAGHAWYRVTEACVVYEDRGISKGMIAGIEAAVRCSVPIEYRKLGEQNER